MKDWVDIHTHVLAAIDDGPPDLTESIAMARAAADSGTATVAATPHLRADFPDVHVHELASHCRVLREQLERESIELELVSGAEISLSWAVEAAIDQLTLATYGQRGADVLIETPPILVANFDAFLAQIRGRGLRVTLAHPERNPHFQANPDQLAQLVGDGVLLQINANSLISRRRSVEHRLAAWLCAQGLVHALSSDGHRASAWRPVTMLAAGVEAAAELVGSARAEWMARDAPAAILSGAELPAPPEIVRSRRGIRRIFR